MASFFYFVLINSYILFTSGLLPYNSLSGSLFLYSLVFSSINQQSKLSLHQYINQNQILFNNYLVYCCQLIPRSVSYEWSSIIWDLFMRFDLPFNIRLNSHKLDLGSILFLVLQFNIGPSPIIQCQTFCSLSLDLGSITLFCPTIQYQAYFLQLRFMIYFVVSPTIQYRILKCIY